MASYAKRCSEAGVQPIRELKEALEYGYKTCTIHVDRALSAIEVDAFTSAIARSSLQCLTLEKLVMPEEGWLAVTSAASSCGLTGLQISSAILGDMEPSLFAAALGRLTSLQWLRLSNAELDHEFVTALVKTPLMSMGSSLARLELCYNNIGDQGAIAIAHTIVMKDLNLRFLDLSYNGVGDEGAQAVGYALAGEHKGGGKPTIEILELEGNQIGDMGGVALGAALFKTPHLLRLNLGANDLGQTAIHAIADSLLTGAAGLRELLVDDNQFTEAALVHLLQAVEEHGGLHQLDVRGIPLQAASSKAAVDLIRSQCELKILKLDVGGAQHAASIAKALQQVSSKLEEVVLGGEVDIASRRAVEDALEQNRAIREAHGSEVAQPTPEQATSRVLGAYITSAQTATSPSLMAPKTPSKSIKKSSPTKSRAPSSARISPNKPLKPAMNVRDRDILNPKTPKIGRRGTYCGKYQSENKRIMSSSVGGGAQAMAGEIFRKCDLNQSNYLERDEFRLAMEVAGLLGDVKPSEAGSYCDMLFGKLDRDGDGRMTVHEFGEIFSVEMAKLSVNSRRQKIDIPESFQAAVPSGYANSEELRQVFDSFCSFGHGHGITRQARLDKMNSFQFSKLCRDAGFTQPRGPLSPSALDVIFTKANKYNQSNRNLSYKSFLESLALVAFEMNCTFDKVVAMLGVSPIQRPAVTTSQDQESSADSPKEKKTKRQQRKQEAPSLTAQKAQGTDLASANKMDNTSRKLFNEPSPSQATPAAGALEAASLADVLTERLRVELDSFRVGLEDRLSGIESRLQAVESQK